MTAFYQFRGVEAVNVPGSARILEQATQAGFTGNLKVFNLGFDSEDSMSLIIEGTYEGQACCVAVGYGMNRQHLAIRQKWFRHAPMQT